MNAMNSGINNTPGRQVARDYLVQNNVSEQLKEAKDKDREKKDSAIRYSDSDEESESIETGVTGKNTKSSKGNSVKEKRKDSKESDDCDDPVDSFVFGKSDGKDENAVDEKELTVLFYIKSDSDAQGEMGVEGLVELERIGSSDDINLIAHVDRKIPTPEILEEIFFAGGLIDGGWEAARRYFITRNDNPGFEEVTLERILEVVDKYPDNLHLRQIAGEALMLEGDEEKSRKYWTEEDEKLLNALPDDEKNKFCEEKFSVIKEEFGDIGMILGYLQDMERPLTRELKSEVLGEFPNAKPGEHQESLRDFVEWGLKNYPARNYVLVIDAHGGAFRGAAGITPSEMSIALTDGVNNANATTGRNDSVDAILFNSCLMGNLEAVTQLQDNADVIIASEAMSKARVSRRLDNIISEVQENINESGSFDARQFAEDFVDYFRIEERNLFTGPDGKGFSTLSAIDTAKIPALLESFDNLLKTCDDEGVNNYQIFKAAADTQHFGGEDGSYRDIKDFGHFIKNIQNIEDIPDPVKEAASEVLIKLEEAVIDEQHIVGKNMHMSSELENATGLTLWIPENSVSWDKFSGVYSEKGYYKNVPEFIDSSLWDNKVKEAADNIPPELRNKALTKERLSIIVQNNGTDNLPEGIPEELIAEVKKDPDKFIQKVDELLKQTRFDIAPSDKEKPDQPA
jgi:hypothetical protein